MKKIIFVLAGLLAFAFLTGCDVDVSPTINGYVPTTLKNNGTFTATGLTPTATTEGVVVTASINNAEGCSVSWTGNVYTLKLQMNCKVVSATTGRLIASYNNPLTMEITRVGSLYYYDGSLLNVTGDLSGNFIINSDISGKIWLSSVSVKFTNLTFVKTM